MPLVLPLGRRLADAAHAAPISADAAAAVASQTFSFQVPTMPSRLSATLLR